MILYTNIRCNNTNYLTAENFICETNTGINANWFMLKLDGNNYYLYAYNTSYGQYQIKILEASALETENENILTFYTPTASDTATTPTGIYPIDKYSTSETIIGSWIDGNPVYRKVIQVTSNFSTNMQIAHGISNFGTLVNLYGSQKSANTPKPFPTIYPPDMATFGASSYLIDGTNIEVVLGQWVAQNISELTIIVEYTKATN